MRHLKKSANVTFPCTTYNSMSFIYNNALCIMRELINSSPHKVCTYGRGGAGRGGLGFGFTARTGAQKRRRKFFFYVHAFRSSAVMRISKKKFITKLLAIIIHFKNIIFTIHSLDSIIKEISYISCAIYFSKRK